ncbi:MAG: hypothetical protein U0Y10_02295 [Spirosomataceae bacterium]
MKRILFSYLHGFHQLYRRSNDADIYVQTIVILMEGFFILFLSALFKFHIPTTEELGNKWVVRTIKISILFLLNRYLFGIRESVYLEYPPMSKRTILLITLFYFAVTIGFLFYSSKHSYPPPLFVATTKRGFSSVVGLVTNKQAQAKVGINH